MYRNAKIIYGGSYEQGELFGFPGVNGAGKATTINVLCTLLRPTEGKVEAAGLRRNLRTGAVNAPVTAFPQSPA